MGMFNGVTRVYFLWFIPQGVWEGKFDKRGVLWWARPFMRYVYEERVLSTGDGNG